MNFSDEELAALDSDTQRVGVFFRLATETPVRLWFGVGPIKPGVNVLDEDAGVTYVGFGELGDVPAVQHLINGVADRVVFRLSGVTEAMTALVAPDAEAVRNKQVNLGIGLFGSDWQLLGPLKWLWQGTADFLAFRQTGAEGPEGQTTRSIDLSVGTLMTGRRRARYSYWTDEDQQARSPGDRFCERVTRYTQQTLKVWPRY